MNTESNVASIASWFSAHPAFGALLIIWIFVWKGFALWKSAELRQKYWFIILLVVNTLGILEIIYLFFVAKRYKVEIIEN